MYVCMYVKMIVCMYVQYACMFSILYKMWFEDQTVISGIHGCLYQSINACDVDIREEMFSTIVFAGGNSLLAGFGQRMRRELTALTGRNGKFNIIQPDVRMNYHTNIFLLFYINFFFKSFDDLVEQDRLNAAWIGGSIMASLSTFPELCMSRSEYDECGPSLVHSKCL